MSSVVSPRALRFTALAAASGLALMANAAWAQTASPSTNANLVTPAPGDGEQDNTAADIIVTAQKRSERLLDVPAAVTAVTADILSNQQITSANALDKVSSSLTVRQGTSPNASDIRIRGVGTSVFSAGVEPSVSFVIDGVVQARQNQGFEDFSDIERIEVLRGPQGTLFGKNATAGVINIVTKRPGDKFEGNASFTIAEENEYRAKGYVSGPIASGLSASLSGFYNSIGGFINDTTLRRNINGYKSYGGRAKLAWDPTSKLSFLLSGSYSKNDADCCSLVYIRADNPDLRRLLGSTVAGPNNRSTLQNRPYASNTTQWQTSLEGNLDLGGVTVTSITGYQDFRNSQGGDIDGLNTPTPLFLTAAIGQFDFNDGTTHIKQFTQELRAASDKSGPVTWVAGVFYSNLDLDTTFFRRVGSCTPGGANGVLTVGQACNVPTYRSTGLVANTSTTNIAAFGQAEIKLIGGLSAIGGIRVQHEFNSYSGTRTSPLLAGDLLLTAPSSGSGSIKDDAVTGKAGLQYKFGPNAQAYATWSRGYKGAAYAVQLAANFSHQTPVQPETVSAWEVGGKFQTTDRKFGLDTALFYQRYANLQVQANRSDTSGNPPTINNVLTNAGSATVKGVELEAVIRPVPQFTVRAGVTILQSKLNADGLNCPLQYQAAAPVITGTPPANICYRLSAGGTTQQNLRDGRLPNAPDYRINVSARYESGVAGTGFKVFGQAAASFQSDYNFAIEQDPNQLQDGYTIVDMSAGIGTKDDRYKLTFFVKNLFDTHYLGFVGNAAVLTTATLSPNNLYGIVPKDANRYLGANFSVAF